jgi:thymidylate synthase
LRLNPLKRDLDEFEPRDVELLHYQHHPAIPAPVAV